MLHRADPTRRAPAAEPGPAEILRALSASTPAGRDWRNEFARLRDCVLQENREVASIAPDLVRLAAAQHPCRLEYLHLLEIVALREPCDHSSDSTHHAGIFGVAELQIRDWVRFDPRPGVRAAAARLLAASAGAPSTAFLDQCLSLEKHPETAAAILAALHPLHMASNRLRWRGVLAQHQTERNPAAVRFQAACCSLQAEAVLHPEVLAELRGQLYCPRTHSASPALAVIGRYAQPLPKDCAMRLWTDLLEAAEDFDAAAAIACHLLRVACDDRRDGWATVRLTSRPRTDAGWTAVLPEAIRLACVGVYRGLTGRTPRLLLANHLPCRQYPEVKAFPPPLDPRDAACAAALRALVRCEPLWQGDTELWRLFGLPFERAALRLLCEPRSEREGLG